MFGIQALALLPLLPGVHAHGYLASPSPRNCEGGQCKANLKVKDQGPFCGNYGKGQLVATYTAGQTIDVVWTVVANHRGSYAYQLCRDGSDTEECFKQNSLKNDEGQVSKEIPTGTKKGTDLKDKIRLPDGFTCDSCTLAWAWDDAQGTKWVNCADIVIIKNSEDVDDGFSESAFGEDIENADNATGEAFISAAGPHVVSSSFMLAVVVLSAVMVTPVAQI